MANYVSGTDFLHSFEAGWETKGLLKVPMPSKLIPRDKGAGTQGEKGKRNKKKYWKGQGSRCGWDSGRYSVGSRLAWVGHLVDEPGYLRHGLGDPLGEYGNLPLEVYQEGVRPPPSNDFDGAVGDMGLV